MLGERKAGVPSRMACWPSRRLGGPQRAMLEYSAGLVTPREATAAGARCDVLLIQSRERPEELSQPRQWTLLWSGSRPGDLGEQFWLLQRKDSDPRASLP